MGTQECAALPKTSNVRLCRTRRAYLFTLWAKSFSSSEQKSSSTSPSGCRLRLNLTLTGLVNVLGIVKHDLQIHMTEVAAEAFGDVHRFTAGMPHRVQPPAVIEPDGIHH